MPKNRQKRGFFFVSGLISLSTAAWGFVSISNAQASCVEISDPVPFELERLAEFNNEWYTPWTSHFLWKKNYCGTTSYVSFPDSEKKGVEHQYYLKKHQVSEMRNSEKGSWSRILNHFTLDSPGVSTWEAIMKVGPVTFTSPKTKSYVVAAEGSSQPQWWAAYYCSSSDLGWFTEGFDIRSTYLPLEPEVVDHIVSVARSKGVPEHLLKKLYAAPYSGCSVNDKEMSRFIHP